ncbi:hypothetical protein [Acinetobacter baumannii]|uniref:hypothetical protein n=1 Tax=Acinetobacter baumannii TaxID=470 RepID=UPI00292A7B51|nr:hypothetical protein [Acinetobacter baumannii]HEC0297252.1 hypothetical protein [Acinetobacter baumannii]
MSEFKEFKVGDWIIDPLIGDKVIKCHDGYLREMKFFGSVMRHATPEEIATGRRIDKPSDSRELETLDKLENHISPNCKVEDV